MAELRGRDRASISLTLLLTRAATSLIAALTLVYRVVLTSTRWHHVHRLARDICTSIDRNEVRVRGIIESMVRWISLVRVFGNGRAHGLAWLPRLCLRMLIRWDEVLLRWVEVDFGS